jgi:hypothetical protein
MRSKPVVGRTYSRTHHCRGGRGSRSAATDTARVPDRRRHEARVAGGVVSTTGRGRSSRATLLHVRRRVGNGYRWHGAPRVGDRDGVRPLDRHPCGSRLVDGTLPRRSCRPLPSALIRARRLPEHAFARCVIRRARASALRYLVSCLRRPWTASHSGDCGRWQAHVGSTAQWRPGRHVRFN